MASAAAGAPSADAIVVAAGASTRMGRDKLMVPISGRPLLAWSLEAIARSGAVDRIVVVTAPDRVTVLRAAAWLPSAVVDIVAGGSRRQESVAAGFARLEALDGARRDGQAGVAAHELVANDRRVVLVHDGARPNVTPALVTAVAAAAAEDGAAVPVVPVIETLKRIADGWLAATVDRDGLATAQTPQGIRRDVLSTAYAAFPPSGPRTFTDEASLLEACTIRVRAIPGDPSNLKVTVPADLLLAESLLLGPPARRIGLGHDAHPFGPGEPLALGGLELAGAPRLHGHSDGDVVLHAVADAVLGAAGLGDLGRLFPADARTPRGVVSRDLLAEVVARVGAAGYRAASVDIVIVAARPRLGERLVEMGATIAGLLGIDPAAVNVKASTGNLDGMAGAGRGISAQAIATLAAAEVGSGPAVGR